MPPSRRGSKANVNGSAKGQARKPKGSRSHRIPPPLPNGEILTDVKKKLWRVGHGIGQGGFGLIYLASHDTAHQVGNDADYVMKVEPISNGPLFCEVHFYQRAAKPEMVDGFVRARKLKYLGIPKFISTGQHVHGDEEYRFLVMQRCGPDLQKLFETSGKQFSKKTVFCVGLRMLDALEYMHNNEYVHADIKASNILLGCHKGVVNPNEVYLVDFGLAFRYDVDGKHKEYKEDPKRVHDGTIEFTSRDAHLGVVPSRRGDLEILGYCLLQWLCHELPWEDNLENKEYVRDSKFRFMRDIDSLLDACFPHDDHPAEIKEYLEYVAGLGYEQKPDYNKLRKLFRSGLLRLGKKTSEWTLDLHVPSHSASHTSPKKAKKRKSSETPAESKSKLPKSKAKTALKGEKLTPAMKELMIKRKAVAATTSYNESTESIPVKTARSSHSTVETVSSKSEETPQQGSNGTGRRIVKRSKAVKTDMAVQTSPALRHRKR